MKAFFLAGLLACGLSTGALGADEVDLAQTMGWMQGLLFKIKTDVNQMKLTATTEERAVQLAKYAKECRQAEPPQGSKKDYTALIDQLADECDQLSRAVSQKEFDAAKKSIARLEKLRTQGHILFRPTKS